MSKKYKSPEQAWDQGGAKLMLFISSAQFNEDVLSSSVAAKVQLTRDVSEKTLAKTSFSKPDAKVIVWNQFFFLTNLEMDNYISIRVVSKSKKSLGRVIMFQLQTLHNDHVNQHVYDLTDDDTGVVVGRVEVRSYFSCRYETMAIDKENDPDLNFHGYSHYMNKFKSGDLIFYSGYGIISAISELSTNTPVSSVGMIVRLPNKLTHKDELFVIELTRNLDRMRDSFTETLDIGFNIFPLQERLHQFHGSQIWWSELNVEISPILFKNLLGKLQEFTEAYKFERPKDVVAPQEGLDPSLPQLLPLLKSFGLGNEYCVLEMTSPDLIGYLLGTLGIVETKDVFKIHDLINLEAYNDPKLLRARLRYYTKSMQPGAKVPTTKKMTKKVTESLGIGNALEKMASGIYDKVESPFVFDHTDTLGRIKQINFITTDFAQLSSEDVLKIMKIGSLFSLIKASKVKRIHVILSEDEESLIWDKKILAIRDIDEIRMGFKTQVTYDSKDKDKFNEAYAMSILYGNRKKTKGSKGVSSNSIDLVSLTRYDMDIWKSGLAHLTEQKFDPDLAAIKKEFRELKKEELNFTQCVKLLYKLNFSAPKQEIMEKYELFNMDGSDGISFDEFMHLLESLRRRPAITFLFDKYAEGNYVMNTKQFLKFIHTEQKEIHVNEDDCHNIFERFETSEGFTQQSLQNFLVSHLNGVMSPFEQEVVSQNMSYPLSYYWIASSHNTYLEGHQLAGKSSVEQYIRVLKMGCRCVELDCWDGDDGEPIIFHGHTLTSKIKFEDVIKAINDYAFYTSPYPVVLSIENHCKLPQQTRMAEIMISIFEEKLALPEDRNNTDNEGMLPSPEFLKYKILVKGKMLTRVDDAFNQLLTDRVDVLKLSTTNAGDEAPGQEIMEEVIEDLPSDKTEKISEELSRIVYLNAVSFKGFEESKSRNPWEMSSFVEGKISKYINEEADQMIEYCRNSLARIYPTGTRFNSSNYDPYNAWELGSHFVALNYQKNDDPMFYNEAQFERQGCSGYILKPPHLTRNDVEVLPGNFMKNLKISVISARQLPTTIKGKIIDPYIELEILGEPSDRVSYKTSAIRKNGANPAWNEEFEFNFSRPETACLIIRVMDNGELIAYDTLMVQTIRPGYRIVTLQDPRRKPLPCSNILLHIVYDPSDFYIANDDHYEIKQSEIALRQKTIRKKKGKTTNTAESTATAPLISKTGKRKTKRAEKRKTGSIVIITADDENIQVKGSSSLKVMQHMKDDSLDVPVQKKRRKTSLKSPQQKRRDDDSKSPRDRKRDDIKSSRDKKRDDSKSPSKDRIIITSKNEKGKRRTRGESPIKERKRSSTRDDIREDGDRIRGLSRGNTTKEKRERRGTDRPKKPRSASNMQFEGEGVVWKTGGRSKDV